MSYKTNQFGFLQRTETTLINTTGNISNKLADRACTCTDKRRFSYHFIFYSYLFGFIYSYLFGIIRLFTKIKYWTNKFAIENVVCLISALETDYYVLKCSEAFAGFPAHKSDVNCSRFRSRTRFTAVDNRKLRMYTDFYLNLATCYGYSPQCSCIAEDIFISSVNIQVICFSRKKKNVSLSFSDFVVASKH